MKILYSLITAFQTYSRIPMPPVAWKSENRRYALCFFPLVGAVIGALFLLWKKIGACLAVSPFLDGAVAALIPLAVTGGIHMDGFCDTVDARASWADREKKLSILKDPHIGSFAVLALCAYLLLQAALLGEIGNGPAAPVIAVSFVLSRALSGLAAVLFRNAREDGMLHENTEPARKKTTAAVLVLTAAAACAAMLWCSPVTGAAAMIGAGLCFLHYRITAYREFGGTTGDIAGWFLQRCELVMLVCAAGAEKLAAWAAGAGGLMG